MALRLDIELNTNTLDLKVTDLNLAQGDEVDWTDLVHIRNRIDRVLAQRERIENARKRESGNRGGA